MWKYLIIVVVCITIDGMLAEYLPGQAEQLSDSMNVLPYHDIFKSSSSPSILEIAGQHSINVVSNQAQPSIKSPSCVPALQLQQGFRFISLSADAGYGQGADGVIYYYGSLCGMNKIQWNSYKIPNPRSGFTSRGTRVNSTTTVLNQWFGSCGIPPALFPNLPTVICSQGLIYSKDNICVYSRNNVGIQGYTNITLPSIPADSRISLFWRSGYLSSSAQLGVGYWGGPDIKNDIGMQIRTSSLGIVWPDPTDSKVVYTFGTSIYRRNRIANNLNILSMPVFKSLNAGSYFIGFGEDFDDAAELDNAFGRMCFDIVIQSGLAAAGIDWGFSDDDTGRMPLPTGISTTTQDSRVGVELTGSDSSYVDIGSVDFGRAGFSMRVVLQHTGDKSAQASERIIDCNTNKNNDGFYLARDGNTDNYVFGVVVGNVSTRVQANDIIVQGDWLDILVTFDDENIINFYSHGILISSVTTSLSLTQLSRTKCYLGKSNINNIPNFKGIIDRFSFWPAYVLTTFEAHVLYSESLPVVVASSSKVSTCAPALALKQGFRYHTKNMGLCTGSGSDDIVYFYGRLCPDGRSIQWLTIKPTNPRTGLSSDKCTLTLSNQATSNYNALWFGSCGKAPTQYPDLPTSICTQGLVYSNSSICVSSRNRYDNTPGFAVIDLPALPRDSYISLLHRSGSLSSSSPLGSGRWGGPSKDDIGMQIRTINNDVIWPERSDPDVTYTFLDVVYKRYSSSAFDNTLIIPVYKAIVAGRYRIGFGEDMIDVGERDNPYDTQMCFDMVIFHGKAPSPTIDYKFDGQDYNNALLPSSLTLSSDIENNRPGIAAFTGTDNTAVDLFSVDMGNQGFSLRFIVQHSDIISSENILQCNNGFAGFSFGRQMETDHYLFVSNVANNTQSVNAVNSIVKQEWTDVFLTYDGVQNVSIYINGVPVNSGLITNFAKVPSFRCVLGRSFKGQMDRFSIWNGYMLLPQQIFALYSETVLSPVAPSSPVTTCIPPLTLKQGFRYFTKGDGLCTGTGSDGIHYFYGRICPDGKSVQWTNIEPTSPRSGLYWDKCIINFNEFSSYNDTNDKWFGSCGKAPTQFPDLPTTICTQNVLQMQNNICVQSRNKADNSQGFALVDLPAIPRDARISLLWRSGSLSSVASAGFGKWGGPSKDDIGMQIRATDNTLIWPSLEPAAVNYTTGDYLYKRAGLSAMDMTLTIPVLKSIVAGKYRIGFGEDLLDTGESNNPADINMCFDMVIFSGQAPAPSFDYTFDGKDYNNGILPSMLSLSDQDNRIGVATFTGKSDSVVDLLSIDMGNQGFSIRTIVKHSAAPTSWQRLLDCSVAQGGYKNSYNGSYNGFAISSQDSMNNYAFVIGGGNGSQIVPTVNTIVQNEWTDIVVTYDGSQLISIYVNGVPVNNGSVIFPQAPSFKCMLGASIENKSNSFQGGMDRFSVWTGYVLSREQIFALYSANVPTPSISATTSCVPLLTIKQGLRYHTKADGLATGTGSDGIHYFYGRLCNDSRLIQWTSIKPTGPRNGLITDQSIITLSDLSSYNDINQKWFGSCGKAPTQFPDLPTTICNQGVVFTNSSICVSSRNRNDNTQGFATVTLPTLPRDSFISLLWRSGSLSSSLPLGSGKWGGPSKDDLGMELRTLNNQLVWPDASDPAVTFTFSDVLYRRSGSSAFESTLVIPVNKQVAAGRYRIGFGEDLMDQGEKDNPYDDQMCFDMAVLSGQSSTASIDFKFDGKDFNKDVIPSSITLTDDDANNRRGVAVFSGEANAHIDLLSVDLGHQGLSIRAVVKHTSEVNYSIGEQLVECTGGESSFVLGRIENTNHYVFATRNGNRTQSVTAVDAIVVNEWTDVIVTFNGVQNVSIFINSVPVISAAISNFPKVPSVKCSLGKLFKGEMDVFSMWSGFTLSPDQIFALHSSNVPSPAPLNATATTCIPALNLKQGFRYFTKGAGLCTGSGSDGIHYFYGRICPDGKSVQWTNIKATDPRNGLIWDKCIINFSDLSSFGDVNDKWFGSCGKAPTQFPDLPTSICTQNVLQMQSNICVGSKNKADGSQGFALIDLPAISRESRISLLWRSGSLSSSAADGSGKWGGPGKDDIGIQIRTTSNDIIWPERFSTVVSYPSNEYIYKRVGTSAMDMTLTIPVVKAIAAGKYRIGFSEDIMDYSENNNPSDTMCFDMVIFSGQAPTPGIDYTFDGKDYNSGILSSSMSLSTVDSRSVAAFPGDSFIDLLSLDMSNQSFSLRFTVKHDNNKWLKLLDCTSDRGGFMFGKSDNSNSYMFVVNNSTNASQMVTAVDTVVAQEWTDVVVTYDGAQNITIYINGLPVTNGSAIVPQVPSFRCYIGAAISTNKEVTFTGSMDRFSVWTGYQLPPEQVFALYSSTVISPRSPTSNAATCVPPLALQQGYRYFTDGNGVGTGAGADSINYFYGRICPDGKSIQWNNIKPTHPRNGLITEKSVITYFDLPGYNDVNDKWFGSCGKTPIQFPGVPTNLCSQGLFATKNNICVSSRNKLDGSQGYSVIDLPTIPPDSQIALFWRSGTLSSSFPLGVGKWGGPAKDDIGLQIRDSSNQLMWPDNNDPGVTFTFSDVLYRRVRGTAFDTLLTMPVLKTMPAGKYRIGFGEDIMDQGEKDNPYEDQMCFDMAVFSKSVPPTIDYNFDGTDNFQANTAGIVISESTKDRKGIANFLGEPDSYIELYSLDVATHAGFSMRFIIRHAVSNITLQTNERLIDCGNNNGMNDDDFYFGRREDSNDYILVTAGNSSSSMIIPNIIVEGEWMDVVITYDIFSVATVYINGVFVVNQTLPSLRNTYRRDCYIGKSNTPGVGNFIGKLDKFTLWIGNVLSATEVSTMAVEAFPAVSMSPLLTQSNVCIGSKRDQFQSITLPAIKSGARAIFQWISGGVNCNINTTINSNWGCDLDNTGVEIRTTTNSVVLPSASDVYTTWPSSTNRLSYKRSSVSATSKTLVLPFMNDVNSGSYRIGFGEDFDNTSENDNTEEKVCFNLRVEPAPTSPPCITAFDLGQGYRFSAKHVALGFGYGADGIVHMYGRICPDGKYIQWTKIRVFKPRMGLNSRYTTLVPSTTDVHYNNHWFGNCGVAPLQFPDLPTTTCTQGVTFSQGNICIAARNKFDGSQGYASVRLPTVPIGSRITLLRQSGSISSSVPLGLSNWGGPSKYDLGMQVRSSAGSIVWPDPIDPAVNYTFLKAMYKRAGTDSRGELLTMPLYKALSAGDYIVGFGEDIDNVAELDNSIGTLCFAMVIHDSTYVASSGSITSTSSSTSDTGSASASIDWTFLNSDVGRGPIPPSVLFKGGVAPRAGIVVFTGQPSSYYDLGAFDFTFRGFTIRLLVKFTNPRMIASQHIFDCGNGAADDNFVISRGGNSDDLIFSIFIGNRKYQLIAANAVIQDTWMDIVGTLDGNNKAAFYVNGVRKAFTVVPDINEGPRTSCYLAKTNDPKDINFQGEVDKIQLYVDYAMPADLISNVYDLETKRPCERGFCDPMVTCTDNADNPYDEPTCSPCPSGYRMKSFSNSRRCVDIDECADNPCAMKARCINSVGSYTCDACPFGYIGDAKQGTCSRIRSFYAASNICVGSRNKADGKDSSFAINLPVPTPSQVNVTLVRRWSDISLGLDCVGSKNYTFWGCSASYTNGGLGIMMMNSNKDVVWPSASDKDNTWTYTDNNKKYFWKPRFLSYTSSSPIISFTTSSALNAGVYQLGYTEDLYQFSESDNFGEICFDLYLSDVGVPNFFTMTTGNDIKVWIDGQQQTMTSVAVSSATTVNSALASTYSVADPSKLNPRSVVAVRIQNTLSPPGFIGTFSFNDGKKMFTTSSAWKCYRVTETMINKFETENSTWHRGNFNDQSWSPAYEIGRNADNSTYWTSKLNGPVWRQELDARWIWAENPSYYTTADKSVSYCRYSLADVGACLKTITENVIINEKDTDTIVTTGRTYAVPCNADEASLIEEQGPGTYTNNLGGTMFLETASKLKKRNYSLRRVFRPKL